MQNIILVCFDIVLLWIIVVITSFDNHYYDEDDIKVYHGSMARKTEEEVKVTLSAEEMEEARKEARQRAIDRLAEEQYALLKKKPSRGKKEAETEVQQMSLF